MTDDQTLTLMMALVSREPLRLRHIAHGLGSNIEHALYVAQYLLAQGALSKPRRGEWLITEKGRIACALSMYHDPSLAAAFFD